MCENPKSQNGKTLLFSIHYSCILLTLHNYYSPEYGPKGTQDTLHTKKYGNELVYTDTRTLFYFSQLSKQQRSNLYEMYYFDFELFNYDAEIYGAIDSDKLIR